MYSRICHKTDAILSFGFILTEIEKTTKTGVYSNVRRLKFSTIYFPLLTSLFI